MFFLHVLMSCESREPAVFSPCLSRREARSVLPTSRPALPTANNAPWQHCLSSELQFSVWRAALALRSRDLLLNAFAQLPNWLERIFNSRPSADDDVRVSPHPDAQRQTLS